MSRAATEQVSLKIADEVWIATALLHKEIPSAADFAVDQILERARREELTERLRPGVYVHIVQHCVANRPPNPGRYRVLFETSEGRRRLYRPGDVYHPAREGSKRLPEAHEIPKKYLPLLEWYRRWSSEATSLSDGRDPLLLLHGSGRQLWRDEPADEYVRRLREGWS